MHILEKVETYQKETIEKIIKNGENAQKRGIVFFGDSHIQYFDVKKYFGNFNVHNCGVEGATSDLLFHLRPYAITPYDPRKVIVLIGMNDLSDKWRVDKLEIAFNVYRLIEILRRFSPAIDVCVISPLPIDEKVYKTSMLNNTQLKILGKEIGNNVREFVGCNFIDVFEDFTIDGNLNRVYSNDGIHLNEIGYALLAEKIRKFIEE